jgi:hypothetical protein
MNFQRAVALTFALLAGISVFAESEVADETANEGQGLDLPMVATGPMSDSINLTDAEVLGNPLKRQSTKWPEDLIVAPIPAYSPQLGWNLTLAGGYF